MKTISLLQPWASLIVVGAKKIETRSWPTKYRGPLAIHASKRFSKEQRKIAKSDPFWTYIEPVWTEAFEERKQLGAVLATCDLKDVLYITEKGLHEFSTKYGGLSYHPEPKLPLPAEPEFTFGDYTPGRFAWILDNVRPLPVPISARGSLGLWEWWIPL